MPTRRDFLAQVEAGGAAVCASVVGRSALLTLLASCGGLRYARSSIVGREIQIDRKELVAPGVLVDGPDGELPIYVRVLADNQFSALSTRCMHRGCQVEPVNDRFVCPCHGSEYGTDGRILKGPTELPLVEYRITSRAQQIVVHLDVTVSKPQS